MRNVRKKTPPLELIFMYDHEARNNWQILGSCGHSSWISYGQYRSIEVAHVELGVVSCILNVVIFSLLHFYSKLLVDGVEGRK